MFDGTKIRIQGPAQRTVRHRPGLAFEEGRDGLHRARWEGWTFEGDATRCWEINGSFHKAHHGGTNWQDFTHAQFVATVRSLCDITGLHPASLHLAGLEVGVNITPPCPTNDLLPCIALHRTSTPERMEGRARGITIMHGQRGRNYRFKVYDKAHQNGLSFELLRYEIAVRQMRILASYGVRTAADLLEPSTWERLGAFLLARFDELLIVEPHVPTDALRPAQRDLLAKATAPGYWQGMPRQRRSERRKALHNLFSRYASPNLKALLRASITDKLSELIADAHTLTPDIFAGGMELPNPDKYATWVKGENVTGNGIGDTSAEVGIVNAGQPVRRCRACGADIGHQHPASVYCSERRIGRMGKSCRNRGSNFTRTLRVLEGRGPLLFDHTSFIRASLGTPARRINSTTP